MRAELTVVIDDRTPPPGEIEAVLGPMRFSQIIRRRRQLAAELSKAILPSGARLVRIETVTTPAEGNALVREIENRGPGPLYLRFPSAIMPLRMSGMSRLVDKAQYALETMMVSTLHGDEAVAILTAADAVAVMQAEAGEERRAQFLRISETAPTMLDHLSLVDLRQPRALLLFLSGSTEARHFNAMQSQNGILYKSSADIAKMRAEHDHFHVAPAEPRRFLMPTFGFWEKEGKAGYAMEHLAVPDAALQFIHGALDRDSFGLLMDQVFAFLASRPAEGGTEDLRMAWERGIRSKLRTRMAAFQNLEVGKTLDRILAVAGPMGGLDSMLERAEAILDRASGRDSSRAPAFSHGDLCFSNILFDRRLGLMRLIDPRGATTPGEALMHPLYDLAKLSHSLLGGYDFINNNLFRTALNGDLVLELTLGETDDAVLGDTAPVPKGPPDWAREAFETRLAAAGHDLWTVRAVELSLFLSMLPLHVDHPRKLVGFALTAAHLIGTLEKADPR